MKTHWVENKTLHRNEPKQGDEEESKKERPQTNEDNEVRFSLLETLRANHFSLSVFKYLTPTAIKRITQK